MDYIIITQFEESCDTYRSLDSNLAPFNHLVYSDFV